MNGFSKIYLLKFLIIMATDFMPEFQKLKILDMLINTNLSLGGLINIEITYVYIYIYIYICVLPFSNTINNNIFANENKHIYNYLNKPCGRFVKYFLVLLLVLLIKLMILVFVFSLPVQFRYLIQIFTSLLQS